MKSTVVVDYGMGNTGSIQNMLGKITGAKPLLSNDPEVAYAADMLIVPGVGAFDEAMKVLEASGLADAIRTRAASRGAPTLGVCLGMQLLVDSSDEGEMPGLGLVPGKCHRFPAQIDGTALRVPQMGWNTITWSTDTDPVIRDQVEARFYFVHSYYVVPDRAEDSLGRSEYGMTFTSVVAREQVVGFQFHPEKSHRHGRALLGAYLSNPRLRSVP